MTNPQPPKLFTRFLKWFCKDSLQESILGDLEEQFFSDLEQYSPRKARRRFAWNVIRFLRPGIIKPFEGQMPNQYGGILKNYFKVARRSFWKNKGFSIINISGLIIGMASALIIAKYVGFVFKHDQFHEKKEQIFAIHQEETKNGVTISNGYNTYWQAGNMAKKLYPEVLKSSHYDFNVEALVTTFDENGDLLKFNEENIKLVDPDFLEIFSFDFISGDPSSALSKPNSVVLTKSTATKYFKDTPALGKVLTTKISWGGEQNLQVTGVIEDIPAFSRFQFDFLKSSVGAHREDLWEYPTSPTYLLLDKYTDPKILASKLTYDINLQEELRSDQRSVHIELVPITKVSISETERMLVLVGSLILLVTWINFINLTSAKSMSRGKETGIRKVLGSGKAEIMSQFVFEGMLINCAALLISVVLAWISYPFVSELTDQRILPLFNDSTPINWVFPSLFLFGALLSSAYPAALLSGLRPVNSIKGRMVGLTGESFRRALVIVQFSISVVLIIGIFVIADQMHYLKTQDLGINLDQTLIVKAPKDANEWNEKTAKLNTLRNEVSNLFLVKQITTSSQVPGMGYGQEVNFRIKGGRESVATNLMRVDDGFLNFYNAKIIAGEDFSSTRNWVNRSSVVINRSTALAMGYEDPAGAIHQKIIDPITDQTFNILGVVEDFHHRSLKEKIQATVFQFNPSWGHLSIRMDSITYSNSSELKRSIALMEKVWNEIYPDQPFDYYFLDEHFNKQYQGDIRFGKIFGVFTGISIFIACLGLFGLSLFMAQKKRKEAGIRKVFGASIVQLIFFFIRKHLSQMIISIAIGIPIAYVLMDSWLENYAYRISITYTELIVPSLMVAAISVLTIGFHSVGVALVNPVNSLRDE